MQIPPKELTKWVNDKTSLTKKLKAKYSNFNIEVLKEVALENCICREVFLKNGNEKLVYAKSFIPKECKKLLNLGNKPLGEILFNQALRGKITPIFENNLWGRKSIFVLDVHQIIVYEFFLESLYA